MAKQLQFLRAMSGHIQGELKHYAAQAGTPHTTTAVTTGAKLLAELLASTRSKRELLLALATANKLACFGTLTAVTAPTPNDYVVYEISNTRQLYVHKRCPYLVSHDGINWKYADARHRLWSVKFPFTPPLGE